MSDAIDDREEALRGGSANEDSISELGSMSNSQSSQRVHTRQYVYKKLPELKREKQDIEYEKNIHRIRFKYNTNGEDNCAISATTEREPFELHAVPELGGINLNNRIVDLMQILSQAVGIWEDCNVQKTVE